MTWVVRILCFIVLYVGWQFIFAPFKSLLELIPIIGRIVGWGTWLFGLVCRPFRHDKLCFATHSHAFVCCHTPAFVSSNQQKY